MGTLFSFLYLGSIRTVLCTIPSAGSAGPITPSANKKTSTRGYGTSHDFLYQNVPETPYFVLTLVGNCLSCQ